MSRSCRKLSSPSCRLRECIKGKYTGPKKTRTSSSCSHTPRPITSLNDKNNMSAARGTPVDGFILASASISNQVGWRWVIRWTCLVTEPIQAQRSSGDKASTLPGSARVKAAASSCNPSPLIATVATTGIPSISLKPGILIAMPFWAASSTIFNTATRGTCLSSSWRVR